MSKLVRTLSFWTLLVIFFGISVFGVAAAKKAVKLVVWGGVPAENGPGALVEHWNRTHPGIQVEYVRFVNDDSGNTKLDVALLSGEQIDAFFTYGVPYMVKRIEGGMVMDLSGLGADSFVRSNIGTDGIFRYNGKLYSVPTTKEPVYMMVNKAMFDKAGLKVPASWTFDEFRQIIKKLTVTEGGKTRYGLFATPSVNPSVSTNLDLARIILGNNYWYKAEGKAANFDNAAHRLNAQFYYDLIFTDKSAFPYSEILSRKLHVYGGEGLFLNQEAAMMPSAPWLLRYVKDTAKYPHEWVTSFAPMPVPDKKKKYYNPGALNNWILMNSKTQYKKETWQFMKYWATEGAAKYMLASGKIPTWKKVDSKMVTSGIFSGYEKLFDMDAFRRVVLDPHIRYTLDTVTVAAPEIMQILKEESDKTFLKEQSVEQLLQKVKSRSDEAIKSAK